MRSLVRRSPAGRLLAGLGAAFEVEAGWELPMSFGDPAQEQWFLRDRCGVADITPRAKVDVRGDLDGLGPVRSGRLARIASDWALVLGPPGEEASLVPSLEGSVGPRAMVTDVTHLFAAIAVGGPRLPEVLARVTSWDPATLPPSGATGAPIADVRAIVVRGQVEIPFLEVYVAEEFGRYAWETLYDEITAAGGGPVGWNALRAEGWS